MQWRMTTERCADTLELSRLGNHNSRQAQVGFVVAAIESTTKKIGCHTMLAYSNTYDRFY